MPLKSKRKVIISTNSAWTLYNFRLSLMLALQDQGIEVIAAGPWSEAARLFENHGIRFESVPMSVAGRNPFCELLVIINFWKLYRKEKPDLVHHFSTKSVLFGSLAARLARVPCIINTMTGLGFAFLGQTRSILWILHKIGRIALRPPAHVIFQNKRDRAYFIENRIVRFEHSGIIFGSGINMGHYFPSVSVSEPINTLPIVFLMFGRMIPQKGVWEYCQAAKIVVKALGADRVRFILIGGTTKRNKLNIESEWTDNPWNIEGELLEQEAVKGFITWLPHQHDILTYIQGANVVVAPSYYPEGLPRGLLEAMACGKAIITTETPGCQDTVDDKINGFLIRPKDVKNLADAMTKLAEKPALIRTMGEASRERVQTLFSDECVIKQTFLEYSKTGFIVKSMEQKEEALEK